MKKASLFVAAALCATACTSTVRAQDLGGALDLGQLGQTLTISATANGYAGRDAARPKGRGGRESRTVRNARPAPRGSTRFRASLAARRSTVARLVAKTREVDPAGADRLQRALGGNDPIASLAPTLSRYGLRADDAADATAIYLTVAWYGSRGRDQDPTRAQVRGVREQMRRVLPSTAAWARASNADKQQLTDAMLIQTIVAASSINAAKGNSALMARTKSAIRQGALNAFKLDMTKAKLTNQGLQS